MQQAKRLATRRTLLASTQSTRCSLLGRAYAASGGGLVAEQPLVVRTEAVPSVRLSGGGAVFLHRTEAPTHAPPSRPGLGRLTETDLVEMRRLRAEDPSRWTQRRLAEQFGVNPLLVARLAPAPAERFAQLEEEEQLRQLRQVFDRSGGQRKASSYSASDQQRTNRAKFQQQVLEQGGLKATLKQHNAVPKRRRHGMRSPLLQVEEEDVVFDRAEFQPGVVGPEVDFDKATKPFVVRPLTPEESARAQRRIETGSDAPSSAEDLEREVRAIKSEAKEQRILRKYRK